MPVGRTTSEVGPKRVYSPASKVRLTCVHISAQVNTVSRMLVDSPSTSIQLLSSPKGRDTSGLELYDMRRPTCETLVKRKVWKEP